MTVSLDGLEKDHIWMRQHPLAFEGACRAIRLCAAGDDNQHLVRIHVRRYFLIDNPEEILCGHVGSVYRGNAIAPAMQTMNVAA